MVVHRGEIWWALLPRPRGSEPGNRRPVLVVQSDGFNQSQIATVLVVIITSNLRLAHAPGNILLPRKASGLPKRSVANVSQVVTLDKSFLVERVRTVGREYMSQIEDGLRLILALDQ